jgi:hypothetical protein
VLGVLAAAVLFAGQWDVAATATSESRAGETIILMPASQTSTSTEDSTNQTRPLFPPSRGFVAEILRPVADVSYKSADTTLRFDYGPRILWQTPRPVDDWAPLILHVANLSITARTDRSVSFAGTASGSIGEPDYSALLLALGTTQGQLPAAVTTIATGSGQATATVRFSETVSALAGIRLFHFQILNDQDSSTRGQLGGFTVDMAEVKARGRLGGFTATPALANANLMTSQTVLGFDPGATLRLTARHRLTLESSVTGAWYSNGLTYLTVTPNAVWTVRLDPYTTFRTQLGLSYARPISQPDPTTSPARREPVTAPVGLVGIDSVVSRREGVGLRLTGEGGVNVVFDPVLGRADPRATTRASATLTVGPDWMFAVQGDFATSVDPPPGLTVMPTPGTTIIVPPIVTTYSATLSARRRVTPNVAVELGAFFADRGPPLDTANFSFVQPSRWVYLMLTASTREMARFTQ